MHSRRVLVVDDDIDVRESTVDALTDHGYDVTSAVNGFDALKKLRSGARLPCVILLDLMMPVMDGRAFRQEQMRDASLAQIPVVVVSAHTSATSVGLELGAAQSLEKPMTLTTLLKTAERFCAAPGDPDL